MATNPRSTISERTGPTLVAASRRVTQRKSSSLQRRLISTVIALMVLVLVLRYLPPGSRDAQAHVKPTAVQAAATDLHYSDVLMSKAPSGEALYLDGLVTNTGKATVTGATAEVQFVDAQGQVIAGMQKPLVGMAHGGTDLIRDEFARNPISPNEVRFFRVAVEQVPANWNHEVPALKIVAVSGR